MQLLGKFADNIDFGMKLDPKKAQEMIEKGDDQRRIKKTVINSDEQYSSYSPYEHSKLFVFASNIIFSKVR